MGRKSSSSRKSSNGGPRVKVRKGSKSGRSSRKSSKVIPDSFEPKDAIAEEEEERTVEVPATIPHTVIAWQQIEKEAQEKVQLASALLKSTSKTNAKTSKAVRHAEKNVIVAKLASAEVSAIIIALKASVAAQRVVLVLAISALRRAAKSATNAAVAFRLRAAVALAVGTAISAFRWAAHQARSVEPLTTIFFKHRCCVSEELDYSEQLGVKLKIPIGACSAGCTVDIEEINPTKIARQIPDELIACTPAVKIEFSDAPTADARVEISHSLASDACDDVKHLWGSLSVLQVNDKGDLEELPSMTYQVTNTNLNSVSFATRRFGTFVMCVRKMLQVPERVRLVAVAKPASAQRQSEMCVLLCPDRADCHRHVVAHAKLMSYLFEECPSSQPMVLPKVRVQQTIEMVVGDRQRGARKISFEWKSAAECNVSNFLSKFSSQTRKQQVEFFLEGWPSDQAEIINPYE